MEVVTAVEVAVALRMVGFTAVASMAAADFEVDLLETATAEATAAIAAAPDTLMAGMGMDAAGRAFL